MDYESGLCLGTMTFGQDWGSMLAGASKEESRKIFDSFIEAGGNFIDTANIYQMGTSEKYVGEFIADKREKFVALQNILYQPILTTLMQVEITARI